MADNELGRLFDAARGLSATPLKLEPLPNTSRAFLDNLRYTFIEGPYRHHEVQRLQKAIQSKYLEAQAKVVEAEVQGTVVNPSLGLYGAYNGANGVLEPTRVTFNALRGLVEACPPLGAIVGKRVEQVSAFARRRHSHVGRSAEPGFRIRLANSREKATAEDKTQIDIIEQMIEEGGFCPPPDEEMPVGWQPGFDYFLRCGTRDLLTLDWLAVRMWPSAKNAEKYPVVAFACADAGKIRRLQREFVEVEDGVAVTRPRASERDNTKKEIVTVKVDDGNMIVEEYTKDELFTGCRRPRTTEELYGYGYSEAEEVLNAATSWVNGLRHNSTRFSTDSLPRGILTILGQQSQAQIDAFAQQWKQMLEGVGKKWRIPIFHARAEQGSAVNWMPLDMSPKDMEYSQFMFILALVCHAAYQIHPDETGYSAASPFRPALSEASPETKLKYSQDTGLRPILWWWENFINRHIIWRTFPSRRYKFEFTGVGDWDEMADVTMRTARMTAGLTTPKMECDDLDIVMPDEIQQHPAYNFPAPFLQGFQVLAQAQQADAQQQQGQEEHSANMQQAGAEGDEAQAKAQKAPFAAAKATPNGAASPTGGADGSDSNQAVALAGQSKQMSGAGGPSRNGNGKHP